MRQFIDGVEVIVDREPPVRRAAARDAIDTRFTPSSAPTRPDDPPLIAAPMLLEPLEWSEPGPSEAPAGAEEDAWFDGTLQPEEPRAVPLADRRWLAAAGAGLVASAVALAALWLATR